MRKEDDRFSHLKDEVHCKAVRHTTEVFHRAKMIAEGLAHRFTFLVQYDVEFARRWRPTVFVNVEVE